MRSQFKNVVGNNLNDSPSKTAFINKFNDSYQGFGFVAVSGSQVDGITIYDADIVIQKDNNTIGYIQIMQTRNDSWNDQSCTMKLPARRTQKNKRDADGNYIYDEFGNKEVEDYNDVDTLFVVLDGRDINEKGGDFDFSKTAEYTYDPICYINQYDLWNESIKFFNKNGNKWETGYRNGQQEDLFEICLKNFTYMFGKMDLNNFLFKKIMGKE